MKEELKRFIKEHQSEIILVSSAVIFYTSTVVAAGSIAGGTAQKATMRMLKKTPIQVHIDHAGLAKDVAYEMHKNNFMQPFLYNRA